MNYSENGKWRKIDNTLRRDGEVFRNGANRYAVQLPDRLGSEPVRVSRGLEWVSLRLVGADGAVGEADESSLRYPDALPGVDLSYTALGDGVEETLELASARASRSFRFAIEASPGLVLTEAPGGQLVFRDDRDRVRFTVPAPVMMDSAKRPAVSTEVSYTVTRTGEAYELAVTPSARWLDDPARAWPVRIDPSITFGLSNDCWISGSSSPWSYDTSSCPSVHSQYLITGGSAGEDEYTTFNSLMRFGLPSFARPADADFIRAELALYGAGPTDKRLDVTRVSRQWTTLARWTVWNGGAANGPWRWTTPGGDYPATPDAWTWNDGSGWTRWNMRNLVQGWLNGTIENTGIILTATPWVPLTGESYFRGSGDPDPAKRPYLELEWQPHLGNKPGYSFDEQRLTDRSQLAVNRQNANLLLTNADLSIAGTGLPLTVSRVYNSMLTELGQFGRGTISSLGPDQRLRAVGESSQTWVGPTGERWTFMRKTDQSFESPPDFAGTLTKETDGTFVIKLRDGTRWLFATDGFPTSVIDKDGNDLRLTYTGSPKRLAAITDTQSRVLQFAYTPVGDVSSMTDSSGRVWRYDYKTDGTRRLDRYTDPDGKITQYAWDASDRLSQITTPAGRITRLTYAADPEVNGVVSEILRVTNPGAGTGDKTTYAVDRTARRTTVTDPRNNITRYDWTNSGRLTKTTPAAGPVVDTVYSSAGQLTSSTVNGSTPATTTNVYDASDPFKLKTSTDPTAAVSEQRYDSASFPTDPTASIDPQGTRTNYSYEPSTTSTSNGRLRFIRDVLDRVRYEYAYNPNGTLRTVTDRNGTTTTYNYTNGNLTSIDRPAPLGDEVFTYDGSSRLRTATDGENKVTTTTYDALDRVTGVSYTGGMTVAYVYDGDGNLTSQTTPDGTTTYEYDDKSRRTRQVLPGNKTTTSGYDPADSLTSLTDAGGTVTYTYDAANRLATIVEPGGGQQTTTITYDSYGREASRATPNGVTVTRGYDNADRPSSLTTTVAGGSQPGALRRSYGYTKPGGGVSNLVQTESDGSGNATTYSYNNVAQLTGAATTGPQSSSYTYDYDPNGNMTLRIANGTTTTYAYNGANQLQSTGTTTFSYDGNGALLGSAIIGVADMALTYNPARQTTSIRPNAAATPTPLTYRDRSQGRLTSQGTVDYTDDTLGAASRTDTLGTTYYTRDPSGGLVSERTPTGRYYYVTDRQSSVLGLTDSTGAVAATYRYDPYGQTTSTTGLPIQNEFGYAGGLKGPGGLYKYGERYYSPELGRWTQQDPLEQPFDADQNNRYVYGGGDPINSTDPSGTSWRGWLGCIWDKIIKRVGKCAIPCGLCARAASRGDVDARNCQDCSNCIVNLGFNRRWLVKEWNDCTDKHLRSQKPKPPPPAQCP